MMRLLAAGRSLMGGDDRTNRYRLPRRHPMPQFGGETNPFASTVHPGGDRTAAKESNNPACDAVATSVTGAETRKPAPLQRSWLARLNPFSRPSAPAQAPSVPPAGRAATPQPKPPHALAQPELSLLAVQVVRNDLSDAEEVAPRARLRGKALLGRGFPRMVEPRFSLEDELPAEPITAHAGTGVQAKLS